MRVLVLDRTIERLGGRAIRGGCRARARDRLDCVEYVRTGTICVALEFFVSPVSLLDLDFTLFSTVANIEQFESRGQMSLGLNV